MGLETNKVSYKDSWNLIRLKELCTRISDGVHFTPEYVSEGIPFISVKDIYDEKVNFNKCKFITKEAHQELIKRCFPEKDDVLITKSGTIGRMALVPEKPEFSLFVSVALLKNKKELIHSKFLKYCLENFLNHINIAQDIKGGLLKNFHLEDIRETLVPQVTLEEQQAIVSMIEELLRDLENGKQQLQIAQQQLKIYRQSLLKWAFEGKLTNKNVKDGELPKGWKWVKLGDESILITKGASPKWQGINYVEDSSQVLFVTSENVRDNYLDLSKPKYLENSFNEKQKRSILQKGDILLNIVGASIGRATIFNLEVVANINQAVAVIRLQKDVNKRFVTYYLNSNHAKNYYNLNKVDFARANLSLTDVSNVLFPLPNLKEQQLILDELESKLTVCDKIEETISQSLLQAESLRQSILKKAFEGRLVNTENKYE